MVLEDAIKYCRLALKNVSRSFALTIPMVEENILTPIVVGYLEARIIDSFEDENGEIQITQYERMKNIDKVIGIITNPERHDLMERIEELREVAKKLDTNPHYLDLISNIDKVIAVHNTFDPNVKKAINKWFSEMVQGMKKFINVKIKTFDQLDEYCYYVGGTIGGFLTDLVLDGSKKAENWQIATMNKTKFEFGKFLQKVNIIRDFREDMLRSKKSFWPEEVFEKRGIKQKWALNPKYESEAVEALNEMIEKASYHIKPSIDYIEAVPFDYEGYRKAFAINLQMGIETLRKLKDNPDVFYSNKPVKIDKLTKYRILTNPINGLKKFKTMAIA